MQCDFQHSDKYFDDRKKQKKSQCARREPWWEVLKTEYSTSQTKYLHKNDDDWKSSTGTF